MNRISKLGLLPRIIIAIILGVALGLFLPRSIVRLFVTFNGIFSNFLQFLIPLIIIGLVTPAISDIGKGAGKLLLITVVIAYCDTVFSGLLSYGTSVAVFPKLIGNSSAEAVAEFESIEPYFSIQIPPMVDVMAALVFAFTLGLGMAFFGSPSMKKFADEFKEIIVKTIEVVIIPLLPIYIFGIFLGMTHTGQAMKVIKVFISIIGVIFLLHIFLLVFQYCVAGGIVRRNPFKLIGKMLPAYFTALGTSSSAATIPVTLECVKKNGVSDEIAGFTVPLCATIHLSGSCLKITACAVALMMMQGMPFDFWMFLGFIMMLAVMMVAAPGVPGGAIMAALGVLATMLGFGEQEQALMIALYITMDNFGTACNVTGDGAIALVMDKIFRKNDRRDDLRGGLPEDGGSPAPAKS
ncbi:MAG: dicarboxylate/amino acid:cation symporter [Bacteroidales bacterium]|nr:dicarboxylate/amino acid:cation symporter [Bacteroidales bacterium]